MDGSKVINNASQSAHNFVHIAVVAGNCITNAFGYWILITESKIVEFFVDYRETGYFLDLTFWAIALKGVVHKCGTRKIIVFVYTEHSANVKATQR